MRLSLRYPASPENAPLFAADIVGAAREISGVELDYSPESLKRLDDIIEGVRHGGPPVEQFAETLFGFGCYVGEVLVRSGHGRWDTAGEQEQPYVGAPLLVRTDEGGWHNPIGKTFKRYENGPEDSLAFFFTAIAGP